MPGFAFIAVQPIGTYTSRAFVDGVDQNGNLIGGIREMVLPEYPESSQGAALRTLRRDDGTTTRDAARMCGISMVEYCKLENGQLQLSGDDWKRLTKMVMGVK
jgi:Helix-turn-helix domain